MQLLEKYTQLNQTAHKKSGKRNLFSLKKIFVFLDLLLVIDKKQL